MKNANPALSQRAPNLFRSALLKLSLLSLAIGAAASPVSAATFDTAIPPGDNFDKAEFRLWVPDGTPRIRAVVVLMPGSNGDARAQIDDELWRTFAMRNGVALLGCRFTDKPHDQSFIEEYVSVARGSGQALLDAMQTLASQSRHSEIASAPLLMWGMSAGGQFNYEFAAWKPERVAAFVVNKGGIYYTALAPAAARRVPGIFFTGEKDLEFRVSIIDGLFAINRRAGALWGHIKEPGVAHEVAHSREFAAVLFEEVLAARVTADGHLHPIDDQSGLFADSKTGAVRPVRGAPAPAYPVSWLPSERVARAWAAVSAGRSPE